jgi:hypothetical protein
MNRDDWVEEQTTCLECGEAIWPEKDRAFAASPESYLCFECAERRGGVYDAQQDRWTTPPDVTDLADERRPHP